MTDAGNGLKERADNEIDDMEKEARNEGKIEGSANVLLSWLSIFLDKFMDARLALLERKLDIVSDKDDIHYHLDYEVDLEPEYATSPCV